MPILQPSNKRITVEEEKKGKEDGKLVPAVHTRKTEEGNRMKCRGK